MGCVAGRLRMVPKRQTTWSGAGRWSGRMGSWVFRPEWAAACHEHHEMLPYLFSNMGKRSTRRPGKSPKGPEPKQSFAVVKVGGDYGEVLFPVNSEAEIQ